jgi:high affinity Mn2+ porin
MICHQRQCRGRAVPALMPALVLFLLVGGAGRSVFAQAPQSDSAPSKKLDANETRKEDANKTPKADANETPPWGDQVPSPDSADPPTLFPHSKHSRFWISGQINTLFQGHGSFRAKYSGPQSLRSDDENATSRVLTLYTGVQITKHTEVLFDVESAGGRGISDAFGLAGFTNLDVVRNPQLGSKPYMARLMLHQIIPLGKKTAEATRGPFSLATELPERRLEIRAGKFGMADFFDTNSVGSDSHLQFLNWTIDNNGAYDYAADTRGYTFGVIVEFQDRNWGARFAEALMPKIANGINLDLNPSRAHADNLEVEFRRNFIRNRPGVLRLLSYVNHANMGNYRQAIEAFRAGLTPTPDITAHPRHVRVKYGFGVNFEQEASRLVRIFGRYGWNDGRNESYAYTEVDNTVAFGGDLRGSLWRRKQDKIGIAVASNGISDDHRLYLALGGKGFLLGDGTLTYGRENILETYYNLHLWRGIFASADLQHINNPGYNRDRGPVFVPALRLHLEF